MKVEQSDYAVFILSNHRPKVQRTIKTLTQSHFTGDIYIVLDDKDETRKDYEKAWAGKVTGILVFDKAKYKADCDGFFNQPSDNTPLYARNAVFDFARERQYRFCVMSDDDISAMYLRYLDGNKLRYRNINADRLFTAMCRFMDGTPVAEFAPTQAGAYIGGVSTWAKSIRPRPSQMMIFDMTKPLPKWRSQWRQDQIMANDIWLLGLPAFSTYLVQFNSPEGGTNAGGMSSMYAADTNAYVRWFHLLMAHPWTGYLKAGKKGVQFCHRVKTMCPKIISGSFKKV